MRLLLKWLKPCSFSKEHERLSRRQKHTDAWEVFLSQTALLKRGLLLEYMTLGWNVVGVVIVIIAAYSARSVALAGFGLDSLIEIFASVVVVWQLTGVNQHREGLALRLIGLAFIALVIYMLAQLISVLLTGTHATRSIGGIAWIAATFIAMLLLASGKRITGQRLKNAVLLTEGKVTLVDAYLAGAVLVGLILNAFFGWWWADPLASLVIVYYGSREAIHALHESTKNAQLTDALRKDI
jgi:divalent metal cation (Fe/Co/Zn/Cd) transporter